MTYPIILAHGVSRFDAPWNDALEVDNSDDPVLDKLHYFKGVRTKLKAAGYTVFHSNVSWAARVEVRARDLERNVSAILEKTKAEKVNIIAHSMGGLDARHMLFNDREEGMIHRHVASLTTVATPHWGSPFADWAIGNLPQVIPFAKQCGLDLDAFQDLQVKSCRKFNLNPDVRAYERECEATIRFQTYAGRRKQWSFVNLFNLPFQIIEKAEGENDGLVSVQSAQWKERYFKGIIEDVDHLNELGWWDTNELQTGESADDLLKRIHEFYLSVAEGLP